MLPPSIYELLPGSYLLIGSSIISSSNNPLVVIAGCLFFCLRFLDLDLTFQ